MYELKIDEEALRSCGVDEKWKIETPCLDDSRFSSSSSSPSSIAGEIDGLSRELAHALREIEHLSNKAEMLESKLTDASLKIYELKSANIDIFCKVNDHISSHEEEERMKRENRQRIVLQ